MADIKLREVAPGTIKTLDRTAVAAHRIKDVTIRTKADLDRENGDSNAVDYAGRRSEAYAGAVFNAARKATVDTVIKHEENDKLLRKEQELINESLTEPTDLLPFDPENSGFQGFLPHEGIPSERLDPERSARSAGLSGRSYAAQVELNRGRIRSMARERSYTKGRSATKKYRLNHAADVNTRSACPHKGELTRSMQARSYDSRSAGLRMKELAIKRIRGEAGGDLAKGILSMPFGRYRKGSNAAWSAGNILRRFSGGLRAKHPYLPIAGAVAVMVIIITIMFSSVFTLAGDADGNDFAYDFYEVSTGDHAIVEIAEKQLGNIGGKKYWKWYGFSSHVQWCACFVSWCADQCGYIEAGIIPKFSIVGDGANWFRKKHRWANGNYSPNPGDIIFFDYEKDGVLDHVGIVESCDGKTVTTIEGNSGDACKRQSYRKGTKSIAGYGVPVFRYPAVFDNACAWAARIAADDSYHYVNWQSGNSLTHECPVCHDHPAGNYRGWNCIGFAFACWRHGAGIRCRCSCSVVNDPNWEKLLHCSSDAEANKLATRLVGVPCTVIRNGGNAIPVNELRKGDILGLFNGSTYFHTIFYEGGGKYADCTSGRSDNVRAGNTLSDSKKKQIKVAIRYIG